MTDFQQKVYAYVKIIPRGQTRTYKQVADAIGLPRACRGVGNALGKNRSKDVPCHRVIRSDGGLGGYAWGVEKKREILRREGAI